MNTTGDALATVERWMSAILAFFVAIFAVIETELHQLLDQAGVPGNQQSLIILVVMVLFIVAVLRFFGGFLRILLTLFLILLVLHILLPGSGL